MFELVSQALLCPCSPAPPSWGNTSSRRKIIHIAHITTDPSYSNRAQTLTNTPPKPGDPKSDLLIASPNATFALPEASRGLYAAAGGLSRLVRLIGVPLASEVALAGRRLTAADALRLNLVNAISATPESVVEEAVAMASRIGELSPDAVVVSRHGLRMAWEEGSVEAAARRTEEVYGRGLREGENLRVGLRAFREKKRPEWVASKL